MRKINLYIAAITVSSGLFLSGCQSNQIKAVKSPEVLAEFEIPADSNHILLPVRFQGKEYQFALDTGSTNIVFDDSFRDSLGKRFLWPKSASAAHGKKIKVEMFSELDVPPAYLGPLKFEDCGLIAVCDLDQLIPEQNRTFDGIIGMKFLKKYIVQIDFDNGKVTFFKGKKDFDLFSMFKPKENEYPEWGEPIPLKTKLFSENRYIKGSLLGDMSIDFKIDSGWLFPGVLKSRTFDKVNSLIIRKKNVIESTAVRSNNRGVILITDKFSVGSLEYKDMLFQKSNKSMLGLPFLSRHLVTFDFPNNMIYLKKGKNFDKGTRVRISLGETGCILSSENYLVVNVDANGPAYKKGIREKDILIKINDLDVTSLNMVQFMELPLSVQPENGKLTFTFKRGDGIFTVDFVKQDLEEN